MNRHSQNMPPQIPPVAQKLVYTITTQPMNSITSPALSSTSPITSRIDVTPSGTNFNQPQMPALAYYKIAQPFSLPVSTSAKNGVQDAQSPPTLCLPHPNENAVATISPMVPPWLQEKIAPPESVPIRVVVTPISHYTTPPLKGHGPRPNSPNQPQYVLTPTKSDLLGFEATKLAKKKKTNDQSPYSSGGKVLEKSQINICIDQPPILNSIDQILENHCPITPKPIIAKKFLWCPDRGLIESNDPDVPSDMNSEESHHTNTVTSIVHWHQPCTSDSSSSAEEPEFIGNREAKNEPISIPGGDLEPTATSTPPSCVSGSNRSTYDPVSISGDHHPNDLPAASHPSLTPKDSGPKYDHDILCNYDQKNPKIAGSVRSEAAPSMEKENQECTRNVNVSCCYKNADQIGGIKEEEKFPGNENDTLRINKVFTIIPTAENDQDCESASAVCNMNVAWPSAPSEGAFHQEKSVQWQYPCSDPGIAAGESGGGLEIKNELDVSDCDEPSQLSPLLAHEPQFETNNAVVTDGLKCKAEQMGVEVEGHDQQPEPQVNIAQDECVDSKPRKIILENSLQQEPNDALFDKYLPTSKPVEISINQSDSLDNSDQVVHLPENITDTYIAPSPTGVSPSVSSSASCPGAKFQLKKHEFGILDKMERKLRKRMKAKALGLNTPTASMSLKKMLVGRHDGQPQKLPKKITTGLSKVPPAQKGIGLESINAVFVEMVKQNVLRDCIVRKTIIDCYSEGKAPTIDSIYKACCGSGLDIEPNSVESHLKSIGYDWIDFPNRPSLLVENHKFATPRIKYLNKLHKYHGRNLVYIFVSEYIKKDKNGWQVGPIDVRGQRLNSTRVVFHAMSNKCLLQGGLEVLKFGLNRLIHNDIISWLKRIVFPRIPEGSVIILGHHPLFEKLEESEERPNITYCKEKIVSWLTSHKVPSVNPNLPKALLLSKADRVILPKTCILDKLIKQNRFEPLHLPKHHMELNPLNFLWQEILDKLYITPEIKTVDEFQDFVAREFSRTQMASAVAWNVVTDIERSYRTFDLHFDELLEKITKIPDVAPNSRITPVPHVAQVADAPKSAKRVGRRYSTCPVCLKNQRFKGLRCYSCKKFWFKLKRDYKLYHGLEDEPIPFCDKLSQSGGCPIADCQGCRRYRYELTMFHRVNTRKMPFNYVISIPPVTEMGKKHWPEKFKRLTQSDPNFKGSEEEEETKR